MLEGTGTFSLSPTNDVVAEGGEAISVAGSTTAVGLTVTGTTVRLTDDETAPMEVALSVEPGAVAEGDTATTVTVTATLEGGATLPEATQVTVSVGASGDTATEGTDYAEVSDFTVTIPGGMLEGTGTFELAPMNDDIAEGSETVSVSVTGTATGFAVTNASVTLTDDETAPTHVTLSVKPASVAEGDAATTVTVTATLEGGATLPEATQVTVSVGASADTATEGTDYAEVSDFTVTIPAEQLEGMGTFELTPTQDTVAEGAETLSVAGEATGFMVTGTTVRLTDDETTPTHVTLSVEPGAVAEGDAATTVTVTATLEGGATLPEATQVTVSVGALDDTATEGTDYQMVSDFTVTIPGGMLEGTGTFELTPTQDTVAEGAETLSVEGEATGFTVTGTTVRLTDDEAAPTHVTLSVKPASVAEGDAATTVTVTATLEGGASLASATEVTVQVGASEDTATEGTDYAEVSDFTVTIPGGVLEGTGTFSLSPTNDVVAEGGEAISVAGSTTAVGLTVTGTTVRLTDDEAAPMEVALSVEPESVAEGDTATTVTVTATLEGGATLASATEVTVQVGASEDTATEGTDYAEVSDFTVTIPGGVLEGTGTFSLSPTNDVVAEGGEAISVAGSTTAVGLTVTGTTVRLTDDEAAPTQVTLSVEPGAVAEGDAATTVTVTATLEGGATLPEATQVTVSVGASGDTATEGTDYAEVSDFTVTIPGGMLEGTGTFELAPMNDDIAEGSETVSVTGTATGFAVTNASVTLTDDETAPTHVTLSVPASVAEGDAATTVTVTATLEGGATLASATEVTVQVGASEDTATEGTDYQMVSDFTVTIPALSAMGTGTFSLAPTNDVVAEGDEAISVTGSTTAVGLTVTGTTMRLMDDEAAPTQVALSVEPESVAEGDAATTVTVTATLEGDATLPEATQVTVSVGELDDTATEGTDYQTVSDFTVTIPAKQLEGTGTFELAPMNDDIAEGSETVSVTGTATGFAVTNASVTLTDDDSAPTALTLAVTPGKVSEDAGATTVTVTARLQGRAMLPAWTPVTIRVGVPSDSATEGTDYRSVSDFILTIPALSMSETGTFVLMPMNDRIEEPEETVSVEGSATGFAVTGTEVAIDDSGVAVVPPLLARFARTVADQVLESVDERRRASRLPSFEGRLAGHPIGGWTVVPDGDAAARDRSDRFTRRLRTEREWNEHRTAAGALDPSAARGVEPRELTERDLVAGTAFSLTTGTRDQGFVSLWARGAVTRFDGREDEFALEGEVASGAVGADRMLGRGMAGLAIAHFLGKGGYRSPDVGGEFETALSMLYPYGRYAASERLSVWGVAGYGEGTLTLVPEGESPMEADMNLALVAVGGRGVLARAPGSGGVELAATTDAMVVNSASQTVPGLEAAKTSVTRLRLGLEGTWRGIDITGARLAPAFEIGVRHDGGDAETGFGADIGAGLAWSDPEHGIEARVQGRGLLNHEDRGYRERGFAGSLTWDPNPYSERGFGFTLDWTEGASATGGMDALLAGGVPRNLAANNDGNEAYRRRLEAKVGYGIPVWGSRFIGTPEIGFRLSDARRECRLGWRLGLARHDRMDFELTLEGIWRETETTDREPEHAFEVALRARW